MTIIVKDNGFSVDDWEYGYQALDPEANQMSTNATALDVDGDTDINLIIDKLAGITMIRINFPSFADGRGFTLARQLRLNGFTGRLRAHGDLISDQYAMARRAGFNEVEIDREKAQRQAEDQWMCRAEWQANSYQHRLRGK